MTALVILSAVKNLKKGIASYLDDESPSELLREVRINLRMDGQKVRSCGFDDNGKLIIQGGYED